MNKITYNLVYNRKKMPQQAWAGISSGRSLPEGKEKVFFNQGLLAP